MNGKQKLTLTTLALCAVIAGTAFAGAPTSQFGFSGWPYRQSGGCPGTAGSGQSAVCPDKGAGAGDTAVCPTAAPTRRPGGCRPTCPAATVAPSPEPTAAPTVEPTAVPTATPTSAPTATPTLKPEITVKPTAVPSATPKPTKAPAATQTPVKPTITPSTDDDYTTGYVSTQEENGFLLLNADRQANGRSPLKLDAELCRLARLKSADMYKNNYFAHKSPTYGSAADMLRSFGYAFNSVGENIAHHATVEKSQAAFMSSSGHRTNILGSQWTKVGIGVCYDSQGFVYVTQLFVR